MSKIEIKQLFKIYNEGRANEFRALKNISLSVEEGQIVILKGVSGSGKSTLLSIIGALSKPSSGEVLVDDANVSKLADIESSAYRHKKIGFIFQSFNLLEALSVYKNVLAPLSLERLSKDELGARID